jgi:hypothetical protein
MLEKLTALRDALAADGVLRHLVAFVHPDTIIAFADGVAEAVEAAAGEQPKEAAEDRREEQALRRGEERLEKRTPTWGVYIENYDD